MADDPKIQPQNRVEQLVLEIDTFLTLLRQRKGMAITLLVAAILGIGFWAYSVVKPNSSDLGSATSAPASSAGGAAKPLVEAPSPPSSATPVSPVTADCGSAVIISSPGASASSGARDCTRQTEQPKRP